MQLAKENKKILFLGHEAARTGAPIFLLHVLRWLQGNRDYTMEIFLQQGGELEKDYAALGAMKNLDEAFRRNLPERAYHGLARHLTSEQRWQKKVQRHVMKSRPDMIYANTVAVASEVEACAGLGIPILWNIHEMPFHIGEFNTTGNFDRAKGLATHFIVPSEGVKAGLTGRHEIPAEKISVVSGFVRTEEHVGQDKVAARAALREELGLAKDAFIVGTGGLISWFKGVDWFLTTARHLRSEFPEQEIHFVWLGRAENERRQREVSFDVHAAGLEGRMHFLGARPHSAPVLAALDVYFVSSREDSFPLVMLEAGCHGLPLVCFAASGGAPEFTGDDAGIVCGYGDTLAAARALVWLKERPEQRAAMGAVARNKVLTEHQLEQQVPRIVRIIDELCSRSAGVSNHLHS